MKIEDIKAKLENIKKREADIALRENGVNALLPLSKKLKSKLKNDIETNKTLLLKEIIKGVENKLDNLDYKEIVNSLKEQKKEIGKSGTKIINELILLIEGVKEISNKNKFDEDKFNEVFKKSLDKIIDLLIEQNQIPNQVLYPRNNNGKIKKVISKYKGYRIEDNWIYNSRDKLIKVNTKRIDETS